MNTTGAHTGIFVSHKLDACFRCTLHNAHFRKTLPEMSNSYCHSGKAGGLPSLFRVRAVNSDYAIESLITHKLFAKPIPTFEDHALGSLGFGADHDAQGRRLG